MKIQLCEYHFFIHDFILFPLFTFKNRYISQELLAQRYEYMNINQNLITQKDFCSKVKSIVSHK
jgi:hypothetical protein